MILTSVNQAATCSNRHAHRNSPHTALRLVIQRIVHDVSHKQLADKSAVKQAVSA
jgi:hypothetical protein